MQQLEINKEEITTRSIADSFGSLFFWQNRVLRGVYESSKEYCLELLNSDLMKELIEKGLFPKTWITDYKMAGFPLILEHEKINPSKPSMWSFEMFKDAARASAEVNQICNKYGYKLKDGHFGNIMIHKNKAMFVDLGSIVPENHISPSFYLELDEIFINILLLWSQNEIFLARKLLEAGNFKLTTIPKNHITDSEVIQNLRDKFLIELYKKEAHKKASLWQKIRSLSSKRRCLKFTRKYYDKIFFKPDFIEKHFNFNYDQHTMWANYHSGAPGKIRNGHLGGLKRYDRVIDIIKSFDQPCESLVDLAGNQGAFALYASRELPELKRVVNTDYDEVAINKSYREFQKNEENVETYLLNFIMNPNSCLRSDIAVGLAITHHLLLSQKYNIDFIFSRFKLLANKYVIIEFMPMGLWNGKDAPPFPDWYNVDWFRKSFIEHFDLLHEEQLEKNRIVFAGKVRKQLGN